MTRQNTADNNANPPRPPFQRTEQVMMALIKEAIDKAARDADEEAPEIAKRLPPHYFQRAALHLLFLEVCGAGLETSKGGDPGIARRLFLVGRSIASQWDERKPPHDQDGQERQELARGAERAALKIVLRALVEHASASDPGLKDKISAAADAYLAELIPRSAVEEEFAERTRDFVSVFAGMPAAQESR